MSELRPQDISEFPVHLGMGKYFERPGQLATCMRSGIKCLASELVRDGRNPGLLVLPDWADDFHPQEKPYEPHDKEGVPRFPLAPEQHFDVPPVLSVVLV